MDGYVDEKNAPELEKMKPDAEPETKDDTDPHTIKGLSTNFLENTTCHGIPRVISERSRWRAALWLIVFLLLISYCTYQTVMLLTSYYERDVSVKVAYKHP